MGTTNNPVWYPLSLKVLKLGVRLPTFNICQNFHMAKSEPLLSPTDFSFEIYKVKEIVRFSEIISTKLLWNQLSTLQWPVHFLGKTLLVFALLHSVFQGQICLLPQMFLTTERLNWTELKWYLPYIFSSSNFFYTIRH